MSVPLPLVITIEGHSHIIADSSPIIIGSHPDSDIQVADGPRQWARIRRGTSWTIIALAPDSSLSVAGQPVLPKGSDQKLLARITSGCPELLELRSGPHKLSILAHVEGAPAAPAPAQTPPAAPPADVPHRYLVTPQQRKPPAATHRSGTDLQLTVGIPITVGRAGTGQDIELDDTDIAATHASVRWNGSSIVVRDLNRGAGTFVNGVPVLRAVLEPGQSFLIGHYVFTIGAHGLLNYRYIPLPVPLTVSKLTVKHRSRRRGAPAPVVMRDISFELAAGGLLAVIGPSGIGKSTLCAALLGEAETMSGQAHLADQPLGGGHFPNPNLVSFVPQDGTAIPELTVSETLRYVAELRLATDLPPARRAEQVQAVLHRVQLQAAKGQVVEKLSGGQRRRLAIAMELLTKPVLLMLDEPTSGLDDGLDRRLMEDLVGLAEEGCTVLVVTHAMTHLDRATSVLALAGSDPAEGDAREPSKVGYFGPPQDLKPAFNARSSADVLDSLRTGQVSVRGSRSSGAAGSTSTAKVHPVRSSVPQSGPGTISGRHAFAVSVRREARRLILRPRWLLGLVLVAPAMVAAVAALLGADGLSGTPAHRNSTMSTSIAVTIICLSFLAMALSLTSVVGDLPVIRRELRWGVRPVAVILSRAASRAVLAMMQAGIATAGLILLRGQPDHALTFLPVWLGMFAILGVLTLASTCLGLLIGTVAVSAEQAVGVMSGALAGMVILSGLVIPLGTPSGFIEGLSVISYLAPTRWAVSALSAFIDATGVGTLPPDRMWQHDLAHAAVPVLVLVVMTVVSLILSTALLPRSLRRLR